MSGATQPVVAIPPEIESLWAELYLKSNGEKYGLSPQAFIVVLQEIRAKFLASEVEPRAIRELYLSLRVEELVLARACAAGHERAWEIFMARYREKLYDIAGYIAKESSAARELADSLYADLYGTRSRDGERVSKLSSYTG